ncbi:unnamed protein product, partial [marine sediment metagenome]
LINLPKSQEIKIRNIRSKDLNEMIVLEGIIRQASDVLDASLSFTNASSMS